MKNNSLDFYNEKVHEECGVFGIYKMDDEVDVASISRDALYALQHRGQESAGIAVNNDGNFKSIKDVGMVSEVLTNQAMEELGTDGKIAIAHVRYTPYQALDRAGSQPLLDIFKVHLQFVIMVQLLILLKLERTLKRVELFSSLSQMQNLLLMLLQQKE